MTAPLRFLVGLIGLWCFGRAGVLLWPEGAFLPVAAIRAVPEAVLLAEPAMAASAPPVVAGATATPTTALVLATSPVGIRATFKPPAATSSGAGIPTRTLAIAPSPRPIGSAPATASGTVLFPVSPPAGRVSSDLTLERARSPDRRLGVTLSSWALWRPGEGGATSFGAGTLGGSQAGVRALLPVLGDRVPRLALAARVSAPLRRHGAEAALGVEWQPSAEVPVRLLAERRQRLVGEGRSAFALLAHGGVSERALARGLALDAYGAAGVVGARSRDLFVEGAATVTRPVGPVRVGAGVWGGAQPGTARLDVGPTVALPLRLGNAGVRVSVDYRLRVAGAAAPGSGPALTIGTDF